ncbi:AraC family transcriptional regulator [Catenuloplanes atrovinosus]|uniref:AraC-like DNA-binding protein n=1 Tax=Catenuloplanes atrovinosus TaxID=137266 RepID=A0AAE4CCN4_9ACTN|nr:AraC family transcriptional regulator [Catenuloplanes atrovinosus]MDR7278174.1 AraC-like DNA-binding protein [Catenuloplanes atrovinosus]
MTSEVSYASSSGRRAPLCPGDPIAGAVSLLRPHITIDPGLHAAEPWAVRFDGFPHVRIGTVVRGECRLLLDGHEPVRLSEGDIYLLVDPPSHLLAGTLPAEPRAAEPLWKAAENGVVRIGPAAEEAAYVCSGSLRFDESNASMLIDVLPRVVHVKATDPRNRLLGYVTELLGTEVAGDAVGRPLMLDHLAQILFVQVLRAYGERADRPAGWLGALDDDGIGAALRAMHADTARRWTLHDLAGIATMSRSAFAAAFRERVGMPPLEYLIQWRMGLARDALRRDTRSISELAFATGYESESAFSTAFRRVTGSSPRQFRDASRCTPR